MLDLATNSVITLPGKWWNLAIESDKVTLRIGNDIGCLGARASTLLSHLDGVKSVELFIDSTGGNTLDALALYEGLKGRTPKATIVHACKSASVLVAMAGDRIAVESGARFMLHRPVSFQYGTSDEFRGAADALDSSMEAIRAILIERTKQPAEVIGSWFTGPDRHFTANEAVEIGLADEVFTLPPAAPISDLQTDRDGSDAYKTPEEILFMDVATAFGRFEVANQQGFMRAVNALLFFRTKQVSL